MVLMKQTDRRTDKDYSPSAYACSTPYNSAHISKLSVSSTLLSLILTKILFLPFIFLFSGSGQDLFVA